MRIPLLKFPVWFKPIFFGALALAQFGCSTMPRSGELFSVDQKLGKIKLSDKIARKSPPMAPVKVVKRDIFDFYNPTDPTEEVEQRVDLIEQGVSRFAAHKGEVTSLVVDPNAALAYSAGVDGKLIKHRLVKRVGGHSWSRPDLSGLESKVLLESDSVLSALAISPDGKLLAVAEQGQVVIYDVDSGKIAKRMTRISGRITALEWDPRAEMVAIGLANGGVYLWNVARGSYAGEDTFEALEYYGGGISAIVSIKFHPSARAFFVVEKEGIAKFWRLLRTEEELGLRDTWARIDKPNKGRREETFAKLRLQFEDSWVSADGSTIAIAGGTGQVFRWKVRGLLPQVGIETEQGVTFSVIGLSYASIVGETGETKTPLIYATVGRSRGLRLWCFAESSKRRQETISVAEESARLLFETDILGQDISKVSVSGDSQILWITEKTGSLSTLDLRAVASDPQFRKNVSACTI